MNLEIGKLYRMPIPQIVQQDTRNTSTQVYLEAGTIFLYLGQYDSMHLSNRNHILVGDKIYQAYGPVGVEVKRKKKKRATQL